MPGDDEDFDVDKYLRIEANQFTQEQTLNNLLKLIASHPPPSPLELLSHPPKIYISLQPDLQYIKSYYRRQSLLLHPDKNKHPRAQECFEALKKAETEISDEEKRKGLVAVLRDARDGVLHKRGIKLEGGDAQQDDLALDEKLTTEIRLEVRRILKDQTQRAQLRMKNEFDRRATEAEEQLKERKRKQEHDKLWEETREERVGNWRTFVKKGGAKKKKKKGSEFDY
ncbi:hypothetical protein HDU85_002202 [Gaertneriomyces sp. JEL0708]|nr:hypothetical protein BC832DRAFT_589081 [Gaertneriomyces semiglobifer]KAJ3183176.1 hypothetical protein HDU85_002202 [Gaertneriomyces sp. JEL0708]